MASGDNKVFLNDALNILDVMEKDSIQLVFTSPPYYNARDYSKYNSYQEYLDFLSRIFEKTFKVVESGRYCVINTSPVLTPRKSRSDSSMRHPIPFDLNHIMQTIGWQFIDDIIWVKPEASSKNRNAGFGQHRKPLAYKPNSITEYVMVYRKPSGRLIDWHMRKYPPEIVEKSLVKEDYETSNVWYIAPARHKKHSAVFPYELCRRVVRYYSYVNDIVLDPFCGSGTLARAAIDNDRYFYGIEKNADFFEDMKIGLKSYDIEFINS